MVNSKYQVLENNEGHIIAVKSSNPRVLKRRGKKKLRKLEICPECLELGLLPIDRTNNAKAPGTGESPTSPHALEDQQPYSGKSQHSPTLEKPQDESSISRGNPSQITDKECSEEIAILLEEPHEQTVAQVQEHGHLPMIEDQAKDPREPGNHARSLLGDHHAVPSQPEETAESTY